MATDVLMPQGLEGGGRVSSSPLAGKLMTLLQGRGAYSIHCTVGGVM